MNLQSKNIVIANDHGAYDLTEVLLEYLSTKGYNLTYLGVSRGAVSDYSDQAALLASAMKEKGIDKGILLCGTGIGISIAANRYPHIYAALCHDEYGARLSRLHNNSNVLVLGGRTTGVEVAKGILDVWLTTPYEGGRHAARLSKITSNVISSWSDYANDLNNTKE